MANIIAIKTMSYNRYRCSKR